MAQQEATALKDMLSVIVAVDKDNLNDALALADKLDPRLCRLKIGKELFVAAGAEAVKSLHARGFELFLDLKFHDIPNTTAQAVLAAADLGVWMTNVHASAGKKTLALCMERLAKHNHHMLLIAVTVLTSMTDADLHAQGINKTTHEQVLFLASLAYETGLSGVVCSAFECEALRVHFGQNFKLVTPGIRLSDDAKDDQARICTPVQAKQFGSDYLVIGRPITNDKHPNDKLMQIVKSLKS